MMHSEERERERERNVSSRLFSSLSGLKGSADTTLWVFEKVEGEGGA